MLPIMYKVIAKILVQRLNPLSASLINPKQTRFIPGQFILENVSLAWLMHDWVVYNKLPVLFIKLDFEKAFNLVEHAYIWVVLSKIGLGGHFLLLVKGLLAQATSKVHINGRFTEAIPVIRGVRQGCLYLHCSLRLPPNH